MAGLSIEEPGVEVIQQIVTASPTVVTPSLPACVVGACIQVVDAFTDEGDPIAEALAGTYRDGVGVVSYDLPSLKEGADLLSLEQQIRVWLVYGSVSQELNSVYDEVVVSSGATGAFTLSGLKFSQAGAIWTQQGVEAGDVVRFNYRGESIDLEIVTVDSDTQVTLASAGGITDATLTGLTFTIVRNPAQFLFSNGAQANVEYGTNSNFIRWSALAGKAYAGSLGDQLSVEIRDSYHYTDGVDGAVGDSIFIVASGSTFLSTIPATAHAPDTATYVFHKASSPPTGASQVLRQVMRVIDNLTLTIETGSGTGLSTRHWVVAKQRATGADGVTSTSTAFSSASANFQTSIPGYAGSFPFAPTTTSYIEIEGDGIYQISQVASATSLTLSSATAGTATAQNYTVVERVESGAANGSTGALTDFATASGVLTNIPNSAGTPSQATYISYGQNANQNKQITTISSAHRAVVGGGGFGASGSELAWQAADQNASLAILYDPTQKVVTVQLARVNGVSSSTYASIAAAITTSSNPAYNSAVADFLTSSVTGSGTFLGTDVAYSNSPIVLALDGGSDSQDLVLDADLLGSSTPTASVYVSYRALRLDVTAQASVSRLISFSSTDEIESQLGVISVENPLALGAYFALLAAPGQISYALGVSEVTATKPDGTAEAYTEAFNALAGYTVYTIVPLTQDPSVHSILQSHVDAMSAPAAKSERIGFFSQALPAFTRAEVIASGVDGNTGASFTSSATAEFSASIDFDAAGVQAGDILVVTALASSDDSPDEVDGSVGPVFGLEIIDVKPTDNFVLRLDGTTAGVSTGWNSLVDVAFTVYRPGSAISAPADQAEAIAQIGEGFADRRMYHSWPDQWTADIQGSEQIVGGQYGAAGWAGKIAQLPPEGPLTNTTLPGFTGLKHTNGYFSRPQLNRMAGGGTFITVQDSPSAPVRCRMQLSTDTSTVQNRELSITKVIDYIAYFLRASLSKHVGRFNITQAYLDALTTIVNGLLRNLFEAGRVAKIPKLVELAPDETDPTQINIKVAVDVLYPANYIIVTIQV